MDELASCAVIIAIAPTEENWRKINKLAKSETVLLPSTRTAMACVA